MGAIHGACAGAMSSSRGYRSGAYGWNPGSSEFEHQPYTFKYIFLPPLLKKDSLRGILKNLEIHLDSYFMYVDTLDDLKEKRKQVYTKTRDYFTTLKDDVDEARKKVSWKIGKKRRELISKAYKQIFGFDEVYEKDLVSFVFKIQIEPFEFRLPQVDFNKHSKDKFNYLSNVLQITAGAKKSGIFDPYRMKHLGKTIDKKDAAISFGYVLDRIVPLCYWERDWESGNIIDRKNLRKGPIEIYR
jgi:hypothetical protein